MLIVGAARDTRVNSWIGAGLFEKGVQAGGAHVSTGTDLTARSARGAYFTDAVEERSIIA